MPQVFVPSVGRAALLALALSSCCTGALAQTFQLRAPLSGLAVDTPGVPSFSTESLAFTAASVGTMSEARAVTLTNVGAQPLTIVSWGVQRGDGYNGFYVLNNTCPGELGVGESCSLTVQAEIQDSARTAYLVLDARNALTRTYRLQLSSSLSAPVTPSSLNFELSSTSVDFGQVFMGASQTRQVRLTNPNGVAQDLASAPVVSGNAAFSASTSCGTTLAALSSCDTEVTFAAAQAGIASATLTFSPAVGEPLAVSLQAEGVNPLSLASATLPQAQMGVAYSYDFKPLLTVAGQPSADKSTARWSVTGTLPQNVTLNTQTGVLSGVVGNANAGGGFLLSVEHEGRVAQQSYTLTVSGLALEATLVSLGTYSSCAITTAGEAKCWGPDNQGQLGNDAALVNQSLPATVAGLTSGVTQLNNDSDGACAVHNGAVKCWGANFSGRLGDGTTVARPTPVAVSSLSSGVASVALGYDHACALLNTGAVKCWGGNAAGQLGDGTTTPRLTPVTALGLTSGVTHLVAGYQYTCAIKSGSVYCWGNGTYAGQGTAANVLAPSTLAGMSGTAVALEDGGYHACAVLSGGELYCWGGNTYGQVGTGDKVARLSPTRVLSIGPVKSVGLGNHHSCVVTTAGASYCWGHNVLGQLGDGSTTDSLTPKAVAGVPSTAVEVSGGYSHSCARLSNNQVMCWGRNGYGALGNGMTAGWQTAVTVLR